MRGNFGLNTVPAAHADGVGFPRKFRMATNRLMKTRISAGRAIPAIGNDDSMFRMKIRKNDE